MTGLVILFIGDEHEADLDELPAADFVIAADRGLALARGAGLAVDLLVGDLDSVTAGDIASASDAGTRVDRHPAEKDKTDLALALDAAQDWGATSVLVVGGSGGRFDHLAANLLILGSPDYAGMHVQARLGAARITVIRGDGTLTGERGTLVTLLAVGGPATVRTSGLRYRLDGEVLEAGTSRGVSNVIERRNARVEVTDGVVLAIQPGSEASDR